jgi:hypothetical protein
MPAPAPLDLPFVLARLDVPIVKLRIRHRVS